MVTGYQRQHRKSWNYIPTHGADTTTTDQYTRLMTYLGNANGINDHFSRACELSATSGMVLLQPYLDFMGKDPAQGELKLKVWEYNSFLVDPFFRDFPNMGDAQFVWCQEYISKREAEDRFPDAAEKISPMTGSPQRYGSFYFLPENYNMARNDLLVLSYVWYKWKRKKKKLYSRSRNQFFDFSEKHTDIDAVLYNIPDFEVVEVEVPTWKLAVVLNDQLMFQGDNPLGFDDCPFIPVVWNYDPQLNQYDLRVRSLTYAMRSAQFLLNRRIVLNHDISEATINAGWMRKIGAVANEDNLKKTGQGWDVIINEGYEMGDVQKILPSAVPPSDMQLADQMAQMIFQTSGVNLESWQGNDQTQMSGLTMLLKQGANLLVLQKYFDQWDASFKQLGDVMLKIVLNNWNASKVGLTIGEEPSPFFFSNIFSDYQVVVEEGMNTAVQKQQEFAQWVELNQIVGGIIPPSKLAEKAVIQGKKELIEMLQQQEEMQAKQAEHTQMVAHSLEDAKIKELYARAANMVASARERHGRNESNIGLFQERISEVQKNEAMSVKAKAEALEKLIDVISKYGEVEMALGEAKLASYDYTQDLKESGDEIRAKQTAEGNKFVEQMLSGLHQ